MRTLFLPGLLSDGRVWQEVAGRLNLPILLADLTRDDTIGGMAARALVDFDVTYLVDRAFDGRACCN